MKTVTSLENRLGAVLYAMRQVAMSGRYAEGQYMHLAEEKFSKFVDKQALSVNSCGSALYLIFKYLRMQGHAYALVQNNTFFATGAMALEAGISVELVDSGPYCPSMYIESLKEAHVKSHATIVVLTHIGGWVARDYEEIQQYCIQNKLVLVEDCAHAFGMPVGKGYASAWSFYPTKSLPAGEGGMVSSSDPYLLAFVAEHRQYGKHLDAQNVIRYSKGMNLRMSEWDAAVLCTQLEYWQDILDARRNDAVQLQKIVPCILDVRQESNYYKYPIQGTARYKTVGHVYVESDQLRQSLACYGPSVSSDVSLKCSTSWGRDIVCLPIGEGIYKKYSTRQLAELLKP
jgi:perosamine synthetase